MALNVQHAVATADGLGDAVFTFPAVPTGETWCGTTSIPSAPATAEGTVMATGELLGSTFGAGFWGPWTCGHSQVLSLTVAGLTPGTQYEAVWHVETDKSEWPTAITSAFIGSVTIPLPVEVTVENFPATQPVSFAQPVETVPELASSAPGGSVAMTGGAVALPSHSAIQGVFLLAPKANLHPLTVNGATLDPGDSTGLLPVANSNVFSATGTSGDLLSFLVT